MVELCQTLASHSAAYAIAFAAIAMSVICLGRLFREDQ